MIDHLDAPAVHHHHRRPINLVHQLWNALALVATAPAQTSGQIVSCSIQPQFVSHHQVALIEFLSAKDKLTRSQWNDAHGWLGHHFDGIYGTLQISESVFIFRVTNTSSALTHRLEHPPHGAVTTAADHFEVGHVFEECQSLDGPSLGKIVHLPRIQHVLEFSQYPVTLSTAALRIDKHQQGTGALRLRDLEINRCLSSLRNK